LAANSAGPRNHYGAANRHAGYNALRTMKNDATFKFIAAIILAGVVLAFANPSRASRPATTDTAAPTVRS
jgi:hypothetical protein